MVDLHTHSTASDGTFSPRELVRKAKEIGLSVLALTDHDTLAGIDEAQKEAEIQGITLIAGVEVSVEWQPGECHLLGLGVDQNNAALKKLLNNLQEEREKRAVLMTEKLQSMGFNINYTDIRIFSKQSVIGRPHFASYMKEHKMVKSVQEAFDKYLSKNKPCFVEKKGADFEQAASAILQAGGVPVLAHPLSLYLSWGKLPEVIKTFKAQGLKGLEAWHPGASRAECLKLEALASELNLIVTAGSDFHGSIKKERLLGFTSGNIKIDDKFYQNFKNVWN